MRMGLFNYYLPKELIAQKQVKPRDKSRLLVINKKNKKLQHDYFYNLNEYLTDNEVLVFNDSRVMPARLMMHKRTGGVVEVFLLHALGKGKWEVMIGGKLGSNIKCQILNFKSNFKCQILKKLANGNLEVKFNIEGKEFREFIEKHGQTPLPPYIKVKDSAEVRKNYQTIYAKNDGSVAAPTAGLHFTKKLMVKIKKSGVKMEFVTLHVGQGTFQPVKIKKIEEHKMHAEFVLLDKKTANRLNEYKRQGKRIVAVGTTAVRLLESLSNEKGLLKAGKKWINIFIYPGYKFKFVDGLITNFHLPKSTLLMLASALAGRKRVLRVYQEAIKRKYRFYSFGDGMFIN